MRAWSRRYIERGTRISLEMEREQLGTSRSQVLFWPMRYAEPSRFEEKVREVWCMDAGAEW